MKLEKYFQGRAICRRLELGQAKTLRQRLGAAWRKAEFAIAVGLFFALPCSGPLVLAHQAWILPNLFKTEQLPVWLSFDTSWGDFAFTPSEGPGLQQIWIVGPSDQRLSPPLLYVGKTKAVGEIGLTQPGTYRIKAFKPPTYWTRVVSDDAKDLVGNAKIVRSDQYWSKAVVYVTVKTITAELLVSQKDPLELALSIIRMRF